MQPPFFTTKYFINELWIERGDPPSELLQIQALEKIRMSALHPHIPNIPLHAEAIKAFNKNGGTLEKLNQIMKDVFINGEPFRP